MPNTNTNFSGSIVSSTARVCDLGGWTETWFAEFGVVVSLSVFSRLFGSTGDFLGIDVIASTKKSGSLNSGCVSIIAADPSYNVCESIADIIAGKFDHSNLLLASLSLCPLEFFLHDNITFRIQSPIPPGASMGTSASVSTALIKAVFTLINGFYSEMQVAKLAFRAETDVMRGQSGTQDQWAAAYSSGANLINVVEYPDTILKNIALSPSTRVAIEEGMVTVFVGQHNSSETHLKVIVEQENKGPNSPELQRLREIAQMAEVALRNGDLKKFGELMKENTKAQEDLCSELVGQGHRLAIKYSKRHNCLGYKVNGAGGSGGSVTLLFGDRRTAELFVSDLQSESMAEGFKYFEHQIAR